MPETLAPAAPPLLRARLGDPRLLAEMIVDDGAVVEGHFELLSGAHSDRFIRFSRIASEQDHLGAVTESLLPTVAAWLPAAVVAPATAGVALATSLARRLGLPLFLASVGHDGRATDIEHAEALSGQRVLLVNDVVTTGQGIAALAAAADARGATVAGACWFVTRASVDIERMINAPAAALADVDLASWSAANCPLCERDEALTPAVEVN
jgi:orotate phosphoribosyltransferase